MENINFIQKGNKKLLVSYILIAIISRTIYPVFRNEFQYNDYALTLGYIILPISFSIFSGLISFSNNSKFNRQDVHSDYINFFLKLCLSGYLTVLFFTLFSHLIFLPYTTEIVFLKTKFNFYLFYLLSLISIYTISAFASLLNKKFILSLLVFPFVFAFFTFIFLPLSVVFALISPNFCLLFFLIFVFFNGFLLYLSLILWNGRVRNLSVRKNIIRSTVFFCLFSFISNGFSNLVIDVRLKEAIKEYKKKGIKTDLEEIVPPFISDEKNGAIVYNEIFKIIEEVEKKNKEEIEFVPYQSVKRLEELKEEELKKGKRIIESNEFKNVFNLLEKAVNMPCRFNIEYEKGPEVLLSHLSRLRNLSRYTRAKIYFCLKDKKYDEAFKFAKIGLKIGDSIKDEPFLISQLVRFAIDETVMMSTNSIFNVKEIKISEDQYREILSISNGKEIDISKALSKALNGELVIIGKLVFLGGYPRDLFFCLSTGLKCNKFYKIINAISMPFAKNDYIFYSRYFSNLIEVSKKPYYSVRKELEKMKESNLKIYNSRFVSIKHIYSAILTPALESSIIQKARYSAYLDSFKIAIGLKIYKQRYGKYPEKLDLLVPEILPSLPVDPFTGNKFIYKCEKDGFLVYSLGENGKDDGGIYDCRTKKDDIGWKIEI